MKCPVCERRTAVDDTEDAAGTSFRVRRRRKCEECGLTFPTQEALVQGMRMVVKKRKREIFDRAKLVRGIQAATAGVFRTKRERDRQVAELVDRVERRLYHDKGPTDAVTSFDIGEIVLDELRSLSPLAHIRYALVFRSHQFDDDRGFSAMDDFVAWLDEQHAGLPGLSADYDGRQPVAVLKRDGRRVEFELRKLVAGVRVAARGREGKVNAEEIAVRVLEGVAFQPVVTSGQLAAGVLALLREKDPFVYLRFAGTSKHLEQPSDLKWEAQAWLREHALTGGQGDSDQDGRRR